MASGKPFLKNFRRLQHTLPPKEKHPNHGSVENGALEDEFRCLVSKLLIFHFHTKKNNGSTGLSHRFELRNRVFQRPKPFSSSRGR